MKQRWTPLVRFTVSQGGRPEAGVSGGLGAVARGDPEGCRVKKSPFLDSQSRTWGAVPIRGTPKVGPNNPKLRTRGSQESWIAQVPPHPLTSWSPPPQNCLTSSQALRPHLLSPPGHSPGSGQLPVPALFIKGMTAKIHLKMKKVPANPFCKTLID